MTTPALTRLRQHFPNARITLLTPAKLAALWKDQPLADVVMPFDPHEGLLSLSRRIRQEHFDLGLALPNSLRSALELRLGRVPFRVGLRAPGRNWLLTHTVPRPQEAVPMRKRPAREARSRCAQTSDPDPPPPQQAHHVFHYLHLVAALGANPSPIPPRLEVPPGEVREARARLEERPDEVWFALNPGAEYGPAKRWPSDRFAAAAVAVQQVTRCRWILTGGAGDTDRVREVASAIQQGLPPGVGFAKPVNLAGRTSLRELSAVLRSCRILLTNDTGPMHLAAALGVPVVGLFGSTSPALTGPGLPGESRHRLLCRPVPCSPCYRRQCAVDLRCLTGLSTEAVVQAILSLTPFPPEHPPQPQVA